MDDPLMEAAKRLRSVPPERLTYGWFTDEGQPLLLWGPLQSAALADLLDAIVRRSTQTENLPASIMDAAADLALQVLK